MKNRPGEKIKLASIDELLGVVNEEAAMEIEINKIHAFKNHPFKVLDDEKMQDLIESVKLTLLKKGVSFHGTKTNRITIRFYTCKRRTWKTGTGNALGGFLFGIIPGSVYGSLSDLASDY